MMIKKYLVKLNERDLAVIKFLIERELRDYPFNHNYKPINEYREILSKARAGILAIQKK